MCVLRAFSAESDRALLSRSRNIPLTLGLCHLARPPAGTDTDHSLRHMTGSRTNSISGDTFFLQMSDTHPERRRVRTRTCPAPTRPMVEQLACSTRDGDAAAVVSLEQQQQASPEEDSS